MPPKADQITIGRYSLDLQSACQIDLCLEQTRGPFLDLFGSHLKCAEKTLLIHYSRYLPTKCPGMVHGRLFSRDIILDDQLRT